MPTLEITTDQAVKAVISSRLSTNQVGLLFEHVCDEMNMLDDASAYAEFCDELLQSAVFHTALCEMRKGDESLQQIFRGKLISYLVESSCETWLESTICNDGRDELND